MNFKVLKAAKGINKVLLTMILVCSATIIGSTNAYADDLQNDKNVSKEEYTLTLEERGGIKEYISGSSIDLNSNNFNEALLNQNINNLSCFDESKIIESKNPKIEYSNGRYVIRKEIYGTRVKKDVLYNNIKNAIKNNSKNINLDSLNCYEDPYYTTTSAEVVSASSLANKYISSNITYNYGGLSKTINGLDISKWVTIDDNYNVYLDESKPKEWMNEIGQNYTNELGRKIRVSGGASGNNHGWAVDSSTEGNTLVSLIKSGQTVSKNPAYKQTSSLSYFKNVGSTFVEADLGKQYLWFYKNGYIVAEGNLVSGNVSTGCATPAGVYSVNRKQTNTNLVGPNYVSPVAFWMPFIGNSIGLHDASWRSQFGGNIYKTSGSHGCVNLPYSLASTIYNNISVGTPVICHY